MARQVLRVEDGRVGFAELFYDLVFVFAITQVSHTLLAHYDLAGAIETGLLFLGIWLVWIYSTWVFNQLNPDDSSVRLLLFALMIGGLFLSMAVPTAFGERGLVFALAYAGMQVGRTAFVWAMGDARNRANYARILIWFLASSVLWIAGGLAEGQARLGYWIAALLLDLGGPFAGFAVPGLGRSTTRDWAVRGGHIAERCGLFVIICLGETLLVSGATFAGMTWDTPGVIAFLATVLSAIGMWWVYFNIGHKRGTHQIEHSDDPGRLARLVFSYIHIPIVAGVVLSAVGAERAIAHPGHAAVLGEAASSIGGVALFLIGNGLFKRASANNFPLSHMVGIALCVALTAIGPWIDLMTMNLGGAVILVIVGVWEQRSFASGAKGSVAP